jgi:hypothetical protein
MTFFAHPNVLEHPPPQKFVCGLACPAKFDNTGVAVQFGVPVCIAAAFFITFGMVAGLLTVKKNDAKASHECAPARPYFMH